jgi:hypothetical protein
MLGNKLCSLFCQYAHKMLDTAEYLGFVLSLGAMLELACDYECVVVLFVSGVNYMT